MPGELIGRLLQATVSGVLLGGVYALAAVGLSLIWGVMKIVNVAHGVLALLASYLALTPPTFFLLGLLVERVFVHPVLQRPEMDSLLVLFGATIALENVIQRVWSADFRTLNPWYSGTSLALGGLNVSIARGLAFLLSVAAVLAVSALLTRTHLGRAIRATAQNRPTAMLAGIDVDRIALIAFGLGTALAGVAGVALALIYS